MIGAAIFDMDGTMFDSEPIYVDAWREAFDRQGLAMPPDIVESVFGRTRAAEERYLLDMYDGDPCGVKVMDDHFVIAHEHFLAEGAPKKPGLDELLDWLGEHDVPCAIASSSARRIIDVDLAHAGLTESFPVIVSGDEQLASKPAPDIFLEAARRMGADPATTLVLEDSPNGVEAGAAGGFVTVMVPDMIAPTPHLRAIATRVCASLLEVRDLLAAGAL